MVRKTPLAVRFYELLLKLYPADFRGRYADEMICFFEESWRDVAVLSSPAAALTLCLHALDDLIRTAACKRTIQIAGHIGTQRVISLGASALLHAAIICACTWLAFLPLPPPESGCVVKPSGSLVTRTAALPGTHVGPTN